MREEKFVGIWVPKSKDLYQQVGRKKQNKLDVIADDISSKLDIGKDDVILDVCCGNGLITRKIAGKCHRLCGVDFSQALISVARQENSAENLSYYIADAREIDSLFGPNVFDKSYLYFAFQYFKYKDGRQAIGMLSEVTKPGGKILIGDIPDKRRYLGYYDNFRRVCGYFRGRFVRMLRGMEGEDQLGWWWHPKQIRAICDDLGLCCRVLQQDNVLPYSHYRFDVLITNSKGG